MSSPPPSPAPPLALTESALSWAEVREICGEMEMIYRRDAQKDAQRLRVLLQKRKQIAAAVESKQNDSAKQLERAGFMCIVQFLCTDNNSSDRVSYMLI